MQQILVEKQCNIHRDYHFKPPLLHKLSLTVQKLLLNPQNIKVELKKEMEAGGTEKERKQERSLWEGYSPPKPLTSTSLRKALGGQSRRHKPGHH